LRQIAEEDLRYKLYTLKIQAELLASAPDSPDLNPLDYYVWSVVERVTNKSRHPNVTSLRITIEAAFVGMDSATLRAYERFRPRIETVIQTNGGYIE